MKIAKVHKIGFVVTAAIALLIWGLSYLKSENIFTSDTILIAKFDKLDGLTESSLVVINGYKVGTVRGIKFAPGFGGKLIVELGVKSKYKIPKNTIAELISSDFMGTKAVQLNLSKNNTFYSDGDTIPTNIKAGIIDDLSAQITPIKKRTESLMTSLDSIVIVLKEVLNNETKTNLIESFASLKNAIAGLEATTRALGTVTQNKKANLANIISNLDSVTSVFCKNSGQLDKSLKNLEAVTDTLKRSEIASVIRNTNQSILNLKEVLEKVNKGQGTLGALVHNDTLYTNLQNSTENLNKLLRDLRINPERYLNFSLVTVNKSNKSEKKKTSENKSRKKSEK